MATPMPMPALEPELRAACWAVELETGGPEEEEEEEVGLGFAVVVDDAMEFRGIAAAAAAAAPATVKIMG